MSLALDPQFAGVHARIAELKAPEDERRNTWLDLVVKEGGTCRGCRATVADAMLVKHPGVCGTCFRKKRLRPDPALLKKLAQTSAPPTVAPILAMKTFTPTRIEPAQPVAPTENTMACPECKNPGRHKPDCSRNPEKKPATNTKPPAKLAPSKLAAKPRAVPARRAARYDEDLEILDVQELLSLRADLRKHLDDVQAQLRTRAEKLEAERKAVLDAIADAA